MGASCGVVDDLMKMFDSARDEKPKDNMTIAESIAYMERKLKEDEQ